MEIEIQYQRGQYRILSGGKVLRYAADYGEIIGTKGADGDPIDVYRGLFPNAETVFIINQYHSNGAFDEHKIMLHFYDEAQAKSAYELTCETPVRAIVSCTPAQLNWWLQYGNHKKPITAQSFPFDSENQTMTPHPRSPNWANESQTAAELIYAWRKTDDYGELTEPATLDSIVFDELADGAEIQDAAVFDALAVANKRLERTAQLLGNAFNRVSGSLKVVENGIQISAPMKKNGTTNIAVMFEMTDGQVVSVLFHNPDTTPAKITPDDVLVSWKWLLNRKDITIVVAKEDGKDLPLPVVARRVMALVEKNTARFAKANANKAAETEELKRLQAEKDAKMARLAELNKMADKAVKADRYEQVKSVLFRNYGWVTDGVYSITKKDGNNKVKLIHEMHEVGLGYFELLDSRGERHFKLVDDGSKTVEEIAQNYDEKASELLKTDKSDFDVSGSLKNENQENWVFGGLTETEYKQAISEHLGKLGWDKSISTNIHTGQRSRVGGNFSLYNENNELIFNVRSSTSLYDITKTAYQLFQAGSSTKPVLTVSVIGKTPKMVAEELNNEALKQIKQSENTNSGSLNDDIDMNDVQAKANQFIDEKLSENDPTGEMPLFPVSQREIDIVKAQESSLDISGMTHFLSAQSLKHALKQHGNDSQNANNNQRDLTIDDLKRIPHVLRDFDELTVQKRGNNRSSLIYKKAFPDGTVEYVERVFETSKRTNPRLVTKTAWVVSATGVIAPSPAQVSTPDRQDNDTLNPAKQQAIDFLNDIINGKIDGMADGVLDRLFELVEPFEDDDEINELAEKASAIIENAMPKNIE